MNEDSLNPYDITDEDIDAEYLRQLNTSESAEEEAERVKQDPFESIVAFNMGRGSPISQFFETVDTNARDPFKAASSLSKSFNNRFDSLSLNTRKDYLEHVIEVQASRLSSSLRFYEDEMQKTLTYSTSSLLGSSKKSYDLYKTPSGFIPRATHYDTYSLFSSQEARTLDLKMSMYQIQDVYTVAGLAQRKSSTEIVTQSFINSSAFNKLDLYQKGVTDDRGEIDSINTSLGTILPNDITTRVLEKSYKSNKRDRVKPNIMGVGMEDKANLHAKVGYLSKKGENIPEVAFISTQNLTSTLKRAHTVEETLILRKDAFGAANIPQRRKELRNRIMEELKAVTDSIIDEANKVKVHNDRRAATTSIMHFNREQAEISFKKRRQTIQDKYSIDLPINNSVFVGEEIQNRIRDKIVEAATGNKDKVILSIQYIENLFRTSADSNYKTKVKTPLLTSIKTLAEQGRISIALTGSSFGKANGLFSLLDQYYDPTNKNIGTEERDVLNTVLEKGAFSLMPSKYAHSKTMVVLDEQNKLKDYIIGSSNLSYNAYKNNLEVALGLDRDTIEGLTDQEKQSIQNYYYYGVSHFNRKRQTNYTADRSSKSQTEELIKVLKGMGGVESRVKGSDSKQPFDFSFSRVYNVDKKGELSGVEIHIKGPGGQAGYSFSLTVGEEYKRNKQGKLETVPIVYLSKNNRVINGMIYVNHSKETLKLYNGTEIKVGEAKEFNAFDVVSGLVTTMKHMMTFEASRKSLVLALGKMDDTARKTSLDKVLGIMLYKEARSKNLVQWQNYKGEGFQEVVELIRKGSGTTEQKTSALKSLVSKLSNLLTESSLGIENPEYLASRRKDVKNLIDVNTTFNLPINSLTDSVDFIQKLDTLMMTSLDKAETATLYSDLLRLVVQQDPNARLFYGTEQQRIKRIMFSQITSPFAQPHELYYGFGQALYKKPTFGIDQELYLLAQSQSTLGFLLSPHPLKHNEPLNIDGNMLLRGKSDSRYFKESDLYKNLGGIYNVAEGAASIKDLLSIMNTMRNQGILDKEDYKTRIKKAYELSGELDEDTINQLVETQVSSMFSLERVRNKNIDYLLYFPFRVVEQITERMRTQQSGRPVDSASTAFGKYSDTMGVLGTQEVLNYENLLDSTFLTTLPPHQFQYLQQIIKQYEEEGLSKEEALNESLKQIKQNIQSDGLSLVRGFVGARAPKRVVQSVGISTMSDFAYVNQGYLYDQSDKSSRPEYVLHHRTSMNLDQGRLLSNVDFQRLVSTKLTKGVSFLAKAQKIENQELKQQLQDLVLEIYKKGNFKSKEFTVKDSIQVLELLNPSKATDPLFVKFVVDEINKSLSTPSVKKFVDIASFDKVKSLPKNTRAAIERILELNYDSIRFNSAKGEFYFKAGVFSAAEGDTTINRLLSVKKIGNFEEGSQYFTVDGFYEYLPLGGQQRRTQKIKFKLPATSQREYRGVTFLTEDAVLDHSGSSTVSLELKTATRRDMVSNLRPGTDTAKGPAYMIGSGVFEQLQTEQEARKVDGYSLGQDLLPNRLRNQKIYAILSPSQIKGFNFEQGLMLLEDDNFINFIRGKGTSDNAGVYLAEGLAMIMMGEEVEGRSIANILGERYQGISNKKQAAIALLNPNFGKSYKKLAKKPKGNNISSSVSQTIDTFGELNSLALPELLKNPSTRKNALQLTVAIALGLDYTKRDGTRIEVETARAHLQTQALRLFDIAREDTNAIKYGERYIFDNSFSTRTASFLALITKYSQDLFIDINQSSRLKNKSVAELNPGFFLGDNIKEGIKKFNLEGEYNTKTIKALKESVVRMGSALNITFNDKIDETDEEQVKEFELSMYQLNSIYRFNRFLEFGIESIPSRVAVAVGMQNMTKMEGQYVYELSKRQVSLYTSQVHQKSDVLSIQQAVIMLGGMMEGQAPDPYRASTFYRLNTLNLHFVHKQDKDFLFSSLKDFDTSAGEYTNKAQSYISEFEKDVLEFMSLKPEPLAEVKYPDEYTITDEVKELFKKDPAMKKRLDHVLELKTKADKRLYEALKLKKESSFISEFVSNLKDKISKAESLKAKIDLLSNNFSSNFLEVNKNLSNFKKLVSSISIEELNNSKSIENLVNLYEDITTSIEDLKAGFRNKEFRDYLKLIHNYAFEKQQVDEIHKHRLSEKYYERMQTFVVLHRRIELLESKITELITKEQESAKKVRSVYLNIAPSISKVAEQKAQYEAYKATGTVEGVYTSPLEFTLNFLTSYSKFSEKTLPAIIDSKPGFRASIAEDAIYNYVLGNFGPATQLVQEMAAIKTIVSGYSQHSSLDSVEGIANRRRILEEKILRELQLDPEKKNLIQKEFTEITTEFANKLKGIPSTTEAQVRAELEKQRSSIRQQVIKDLKNKTFVGKNYYGFNITSGLNSLYMSQTRETVETIVNRIIEERLRKRYHERQGVIDKTKDKFLGTKSQTFYLEEIINKRRDKLISEDKSFMPNEYYTSFFNTLFNRVFGYHSTVKEFEDSYTTRLADDKLVEIELTNELIKESGVYDYYQKDLEDRIKSAQVSDPASEYLHEGMELVRKLSFNLKHGKLDPVQKHRAKALYDNITKTQRIILPQLLVLDENFKKGTYKVTYAATDKYKPAEGLLLGLDIMQKLSLVFQTQSSKALLIQMQLAFELQSSFGLLAKITKQAEEGSAVIISTEEYDQYQSLVALLGSTLTETFDLLRNQETIRQAGGERFKVTGISSIAMSTLLAAQDEIVAGSRFFEVAREGTDSVISSKKAQRRLKNVNTLYETDPNKALQLLNKLRGLYLSQNNIIDSRQITIEHLDKIQTLQPKTEEEYNKLDAKGKRELNTRIEDYLLRLVLETGDFSSVKVDPSSKPNTLEERREKNLKRISLGQQIRATMIRQGAPFGSSWRSRTGHVLKRVLTARQLIERGKVTGTHIVPDEKAIGNNTLMLMSALGSHYTQMGDNDGDSFQTSVTQLAHITAKINQKQAEIDKIKAEIEGKRESRLEHDPNISKYDLEILLKSTDDQLRKEAKSLEKERILLIAEYNALKDKAREQSKAGIRKYSNVYTAIPKEILGDENLIEDMLLQSFVKQYRDTLGGTYDNTNIVMKAAGMLTTDRLAKLKIEREGTNYKINEDSLRSLNLESENEAKLKQEFDYYQKNIESDYSSLTEEQLQTEIKKEIANFIAHTANIEASYSTTISKGIASGLGSIIDEQALTELQAILGSSGGSLLGTTFNVLVPLVSLQMAEVAAQRSMFSPELNSYKLALLTAVNNRISELSTISSRTEEEQELLNDALRQQDNLINNRIGVQEKIKFEKAERQVDVALRFVVTTQQFLRDAGLKPKEAKSKNPTKGGTTLLEAAGTFTLTDEESNKYGIAVADQVVGLANILSRVTGTEQQQSKSRDEIITRFLATKLGSNLNLLDDDGNDVNFKTIRAFGALKLMSEFVGNKFSSPKDMYENSILSDVIKSAHSTSKYENLSINEFLPEFITDIYSKFQTDYIINSVLELDQRGEFNKKGRSFVEYYGVQLEKTSGGQYTVKDDLDSSKIQQLVDKEKSRFTNVDDSDALDKHLVEYKAEIESRARAIQKAITKEDGSAVDEDQLFKTALETSVNHLVQTDAEDFKGSLKQLKRFHETLGNMQEGGRLDDLQQDLALYNEVFAQRLASGHVDSSLWTKFFANYLEELQSIKETSKKEDPSNSPLTTTGLGQSSLAGDPELLNYVPTAKDRYNLIRDFTIRTLNFDSIKDAIKSKSSDKIAEVDKKIDEIRSGLEEKVNAAGEAVSKLHPNEKLKLLKEKARARILKEETARYESKYKATRRPGTVSEKGQSEINKRVAKRLTKITDEGIVERPELEYYNSEEKKEYEEIIKYKTKQKNILINDYKDYINKTLLKPIIESVKQKYEGFDNSSLKAIYEIEYRQKAKSFIPEDDDIYGDIWAEDKDPKKNESRISKEKEQQRKIKNFVIRKRIEEKINKLGGMDKLVNDRIGKIIDPKTKEPKGIDRIVDDVIRIENQNKVNRSKKEARSKEEKKIAKLQAQKQGLSKEQIDLIDKIDSLRTKLDESVSSDVSQTYKIAKELAELSKDYMDKDTYNSFMGIISTIDSLDKSAIQYAAEENAFTTVVNELQSEYNRLVDERSILEKEGKDTKNLNNKLDQIKQEIDETNRSRAVEVLANQKHSAEGDIMQELTEALNIQADKISKQAYQQHIHKEVQKVRRINALSEAVSLLAIPTLFSFVTDPGSSIGQLASGATDLYQSYLTSREREGKDAERAAVNFRAARIRSSLMYGSGSTQSLLTGIAFEGVYQASSLLSSKAIEGFYKASPKVAAGPVGRFVGELIGGVVGLSIAGLVTNRRAGLPNENYTERDEAEVFIQQIVRSTREALDRAAEIQVTSMSIDVQDNDGSDISAELNQSDISEPGSIVSSYEKNIILNIDGEEPQELPFDFS